jgi:L,D-peptidoglycan transpeptidase YkuD (ErfK/YbiS/YcfS/YnhG family)
MIDPSKQPLLEDEQNLTPEQAQLQIARLQKQKAEAEAGRERIRIEREREQETARQQNAVETFKAAVGRTGIRFHGDLEEVQIALGASGYSLTPSATGNEFRVLDKSGTQIQLEKALEDFARAKPFWVHSGDSHLKPRDENGQWAPLSRDDFGNNVAAKVRWINENPGEWEKLPQHRTAKVGLSRMTAQQYRALHPSEKVVILAKIGEAGVAEILRRK